MMINQDHSEHYYEIVETISNPTISFMVVEPDDRPAAIKQVLHNFVDHQYLDHELTEAEADDLHNYINERSYTNA